MKRDVAKLSAERFDVVVVGGGIYGACLAWDAALRGLRVALVEKGDFGQATSANSMKIVHGGLRYLQQANIRKMRRSGREQQIFLRIAPHLVKPFPFIMPTYGHGLHGREALRIALAINNLVSFDRNQTPGQFIPAGTIIDREECLRRAPGIRIAGLTGAAVWHDALMLDSERLVLAIVRAAVDAGAEVANYVEARRLIRNGKQVVGLGARDCESGDDLEIQARVVVATSGPWRDDLFEKFALSPSTPARRWVKAINLVTRQVGPECALGVSSRPGGRLYFIIPWQGRSLIGTAYVQFDGSPTELEIKEADVVAFLKEINEAFPAAELRPEDVHLAHGGLLPADLEDVTSPETTHHILNGQTCGAPGFLSVTGAKYTMARAVAEETMGQVFETLGIPAPRCRSGETPVFGGDVGQFEEFVSSKIVHRQAGLDPERLQALLERHGARVSEVLACQGHSGWSEAIVGSNVIQAELVYAVRSEMVQRLTDAVARRTPIATAGHPGLPCLQAAGEVVGAELSWTAERIAQEVSEADRFLRCERYAQPVSI